MIRRKKITFQASGIARKKSLDLSEFGMLKKQKEMLCVLNIVGGEVGESVAGGEVFEIIQGPDQVGHSRKLELYYSYNVKTLDTEVL